MLCYWLEQWGDAPDLELLVDYAYGHLSTWHPGLRPAPDQWILDIDEAPRSAAWRLVGKASISGGLYGDRFLRALDSGHPAAASLEALTLRGDVGPATLKLLCEIDLPNLKSLDVGANRLGAAEVKLLSGARFWPQLRELCLDFNPIQNQGLDVLSKEGPPRLLKLSVAQCGLQADGAAVLSSARFAECLTALDLRENNVHTVTNLHSLPSLCELNLRRCEVGADTLNALCETGFASRAQTLDLSYTDVKPLFATLFGQPWPRLLSLYLRATGVGSRDVGNTLSGENVPALKILDLSDNKLGVLAAKGISGLSDLGMLYLSYCGLGDKGMQHLAASGMRNLHTLHVAKNRLSADGLRSLLGAEWSAGLKVLNLSSNPLGVHGAYALVEARHLGLERLVLHHTEIAAEDIKMLHETPHLGPALRA